MKTRTRLGDSTKDENRATQSMQTVHAAVPQTRIVFRLNLSPTTGAIKTPMICAIPVIEVPIVTALSLVKTD